MASMRTICFLFVWFGIQAAYLGYSVYSLWMDPGLARLRSIVGIGLPISRASANLINLNFTLLFFSIISKLRTTFINRAVPFDSATKLHTLVGFSIVVLSIIHSLAHYVNFLNISIASKATISPLFLTFATGPGVTGQVVSVCLFLISTAAVTRMRRKHFKVFWFSHHIFVLLVAGLLMHGSFCFYKSTTAGDECKGGPQFYKFLLVSLSVYIVERVMREYRGRQSSWITKVIQHPSKVIQIQFMKPGMATKPGQYVYICCPEISLYEWHPFTLTSSPNEVFHSVHVRIVGDWTTAFAKRLGYQDSDTGAPLVNTLPYIMVDGAFGTPSQDALHHKTALLIGAGIGVTPFASILKSIWYAHKTLQTTELKRVHFLWICREKSSFEWFAELLHVIEKDFEVWVEPSKEGANEKPVGRNRSVKRNGSLHIRNTSSRTLNSETYLSLQIYLTQSLSLNEVRHIVVHDEAEVDALTTLQTPTFYGRPNLSSVFAEVSEGSDGDVGGPVGLGNSVEAMCKKFTTKDRTFHIGKENF